MNPSRWQSGATEKRFFQQMLLNALKAQKMNSYVKLGVVRGKHGMTHNALNSGNNFFLPEMRQGRIYQYNQRLTRDNVFVSINTRPAQRKVINVIMINFILSHFDRCFPINGVSGVFPSVVFSSFH